MRLLLASAFALLVGAAPALAQNCNTFGNTTTCDNGLATMV